MPPNQAEMMVDAVRAKGLPVAYLAFEGEQHGFRKAENIKRVLDAELYFYSKVFGFDLAETIRDRTHRKSLEVHNRLARWKATLSAQFDHLLFFPKLLSSAFL